MRIGGWHRHVSGWVWACLLWQSLWGGLLPCLTPMDTLPPHAMAALVSDDCHADRATPSDHATGCADCVACLHSPAGPPRLPVWQSPPPAGLPTPLAAWPLPPSPDLPGLERPPRRWT